MNGTLWTLFWDSILLMGAARFLIAVLHLREDKRHHKSSEIAAKDKRILLIALPMTILAFLILWLI